MIRTFSLIVILSAIIVKKVHSQEVCEAFTYDGFSYQQKTCSMYCCGSCSYRYCCTDVKQRIEQKDCVGEDCKAYKDQFGNKIDARQCPEQLFCCGSCHSRTCCSNPTLKVNQKSCDTFAILESWYSWLILASLVLGLISCILAIILLYKRKRKIQALNSYNSTRVTAAQPTNSYNTTRVYPANETYGDSEYNTINVISSSAAKKTYK